MPYVMHHLRNGNMSHSTLHEMSAAEFKQASTNARPCDRYEQVPAERAHKFVRNDGTHTTGLWVDFDGRIRKAKPGN